MGTFQHHAVIVTGNANDDELRRTREIAEGLGCACTDIVGSPVNGFHSFTVMPDGSKEGWEASDVGDSQRERLLDHLVASAHWWVEVSWGELGAGARSDHSVPQGDEDRGLWPERGTVA